MSPLFELVNPSPQRESVNPDAARLEDHYRACFEIGLYRRQVGEQRIEETPSTSFRHTAK